MDIEKCRDCNIHTGYECKDGPDGFIIQFRDERLVQVFSLEPGQCPLTAKPIQGPLKVPVA